MEYKVDYELPTKEELKQYSKDTLTMLFQNKWLGLKLLIGGIIGSSIVGLIILLPFVIGIRMTDTGFSPEFMLFFYKVLTDFARLIFSCVPFWLILFYTGYRLMENRKAVIPTIFVVKAQVSLLKHLWSPGILAVTFGILFTFNGLFYHAPTESPQNFEGLGSGSALDLGSTIVSAFISKGMGLDIGFYWFGFIHIMIFSALLFGKEFTPNISYTLRNLFLPMVSFDKRMRMFFSFIILDLIGMLIGSVLTQLIPGANGTIASIVFRSMYYLFIAGVLYCYCVDKIEGRKLKKKVKEEKHSGIMAPMGA